MEGLLLLLGGLEIVLGGLVTAYPGLLPSWVGLVMVGIGFLTIAAALYRMRRDAWGWVLARARAQIASEHRPDSNQSSATGSFANPVLPQRDVPIRSAVYFAIAGKWVSDPDFHQEKLTDPVFQACADMRQFGLDGELTIWGKQSLFGTGVYLKIPSDEWAKIEIEVLRVLMLDDQSTGAKDAGRMTGNLEFEDLWTSRSQVERLFPVPLIKG